MRNEKTLSELVKMTDDELMIYLVQRYADIPELVPVVFKDTIEARKILEVIHD